MSVTKVTLRENCLSVINKAKNYDFKTRSCHLNRKLLHNKKLQKAQSVLGFWPMQNEADIRKTLKQLRRTKKVYLPFMQDDSFKMVPFRYPLYKKRFGILEPGHSNRKINKIDVAIVPIVGVDGNGRRVGFGKGMYDRFFARLKKRPYVIFVQNRLCKTTQHICDDYDVKADHIITPHLSFDILKGRHYDERDHLRRWRCHP